VLVLHIGCHRPIQQAKARASLAAAEPNPPTAATPSLTNSSGGIASERNSSANRESNAQNSQQEPQLQPQLFVGVLPTALFKCQVRQFKLRTHHPGKEGGDPQKVLHQRATIFRVSKKGSARLIKSTSWGTAA